LVIGPIKGEQLHIQPDIWIFYDFLSENQIQIMKSLAKPMLKRAIVRNPQTGKYETADYRISKSAWLKDEDHKMFPYLTKMVEATTNLSLNTAEEWQVDY
jgi:prolyl 4-hydroxylase